jgi:hypothetical protein
VAVCAIALVVALPLAALPRPIPPLDLEGGFLQAIVVGESLGGEDADGGMKAHSNKLHRQMSNRRDFATLISKTN